VLSACRKSDRNNDKDITLAGDAVNAQTALFEVFLATHEGCSTSTGIKSFLTCAVITIDTLRAPRQLTIDYGTTGCASPAGRNRKGKIIVYQTGHYTQAGGLADVYFDTFYINGYNYNGHFTVSGLGSNAYKLSPNNLRITAPDSSFSYLLGGSLTLGQTAGTATGIADDDVFNATGNLVITGRKGNTGTCTVDSGQQLVITASCAQAVSGTMTMSATGQSPRLLDFGTGSCDNQATVTENTVKSVLNISF
jgi:hypothetical protein